MDILEEWRVPEMSRATVVFPCLEDMIIECCPKLKEVPLLTQLSSLHSLKLDSCDQLSYIGLSSEWLPANLRKISIQVCPNLKSLPNIYGCSFLKEINLKKCEALDSLPQGLASRTSLENLVIRDCPNLRSLPTVTWWYSLRMLVLQKCDKILELPGGFRFCTSLQRLDILSNFNLKDLPDDIRELRSLCFLNITICPGLKKFPDYLGYLSSLKVLTIGGFSETLKEFPPLGSIDHNLPASLECLLLLGWRRVKSLPQLNHFIALKRLEIWSFNRLEALPDWLGDISSLQSLKIHQCENLKQLPSIQAMQQLTQLKRLFIHNCPELNRRCAGEGSEWSKISHIKEVIIKNDDQPVSGNFASHH